MGLYLYSAFLVLMTTQSSLQYSFTFTPSHTHSYSASISSTLLFYEAQFRVQGHFGMHIFFFWEDWGSNCRNRESWQLCTSISSTLLFYEAQFGVQHLAQGHFGMQICWEDWGPNCPPSGWTTTTLPRQPQPPRCKSSVSERVYWCVWDQVLKVLIISQRASHRK